MGGVIKPTFSFSPWPARADHQLSRACGFIFMWSGGQSVTDNLPSTRKSFPPAGIRLWFLAMTSYSQPIVICISLLSLFLDSFICSLPVATNTIFSNIDAERGQKMDQVWNFDSLKCDWWWCQRVLQDYEPCLEFNLPTLRNQVFLGYPWVSSYILAGFLIFLCRKSQRPWFLGTGCRGSVGRDGV